jgi:hypothetical protein
MLNNLFTINKANVTLSVAGSGKPSIAYLTNDWVWGTDPLQPNGCAWYRCVLPGMELEKKGWITGVGVPCFSEKDGFGIVSDDTRGIHGWDIIVLKLLMDRSTLLSLDYAKDLGQKIVVDVDDFFDGLDPSNRAYAVTDPKKNPNDNRQIYAEIVKKADAVITSTPFLYEYYSSKRKNVFMVRNGIDEKRYQNIKRYRRSYQKTKLGWVGATHWRSGDLEILAPFMNEFLTENKSKFHHSGHSPGAPMVKDLIKIEDKFFSKSGMMPIGQYPLLFDPIDIGVAPLNNIPFNEAKSFIKGLEYAAASVPFVSSPLPEYKYLEESGIGMTASSPEEWKGKLQILMDPKERAKEVAKNFSNLKNFSMDKRADEWVQVMSQIRGIK